MTLRPFAAAVALTLLSTTALAQDATVPEVQPEAMRAHVAFLADDLLEGRNAGSRGFDIAARYVATQFEGLGLTPAVDGKWYQPVTLSMANLKDGAPARISIGETSFDNGTDAIVTAFAREPDQTLSAGAVFAGFGIQSPENGMTDYAGLNVKGKFVVVLSGFPKGMQSEIGAHLNAEKVMMAQAAGAIGIISIPTPEALGRRPWKSYVANSQGPVVSWIETDGKPYVRAPGMRGSATVTGKAADALFAGAPRSLQSALDIAAKQGGKPKGFALKPTVTITRASTVSTAQSQNVIGIIPGSDPALANEYVLLMAHLDHEGIKETAEGPDKLYNGAMDNAAGTATLLEVARAFMATGAKPKRPIMLAAVTAEEDGLLGSQYLAKHPVLPAGGKVVGVVNLDMPILLYDFQDVIAFGAEHSTLGPLVGRAAASAGVKLSPDPLPAEGLFTRSDHYRFVQEGVPSVFLMTGFAGEGQKQFEDFLKTHYHKPSDQIDLPFDWKAAAKFAKINYLIARDIANAPATPLWYEKDFFGDVFAPGAPKAKMP
ncbi:M28 family metallopeptidase [Sphingobium algorifonticola]|uniref:M20/M25/M40 family metallo-hydrolase n=1 Tax=Sphingobium algorifonticola TaxID=2008318 RepID=A0A437J8T4_9SPHN|nr:M28 family metallopeptidase [Sphingobium algorifonticola]RVT41921.1 M20/M25/M40 family metallo-hydrolase [Sphingobium algorifonticola]